MKTRAPQGQWMITYATHAGGMVLRKDEPPIVRDTQAAVLARFEQARTAASQQGRTISFAYLYNDKGFVGTLVEIAGL